MLFAPFKHHQSEIQLKRNEKFACAKLALKKIHHHFIARLSPFPLLLTSKCYQHYKEPMFLHL